MVLWLSLQSPTYKLIAFQKLLLKSVILNHEPINYFKQKQVKFGQRTFQRASSVKF